MPIAKSIISSIQKGGVATNIPELQAWIGEYVKVRNVTVYESVLEKMRNIAFKAWQFTYRADPAKIRNELSSLPITKESGGIRRKNPQFVGLYKLMNWERKRKGLQVLGNTSKIVTGIKIRKSVSKDYGYGGVEKTTTYKIRKTYGVRSGNYMDGKYKNFIKARYQSARWLALGWKAALASLGISKTRGQDWGGGQEGTLKRIIDQKGAGSNIVKFKPGNTEFSIFNGLGMFDARNKKPYPMRPDSDISKARRVQEAGLNMAVEAEIKNMASLIASRTSEIWYGKKIKVKAS